VGGPVADAHAQRRYGVTGARVPAEHVRLLAKLGGPATPAGARAAALGSGGEADVYALDDTRVLRVHHGDPGELAAELEEVYHRWARTAGRADASGGPGFALPTVLDSGVDGRLYWQVMRRFPGQTVTATLQTLPGPARARLLAAYVDAAAAIGSIESAACYGTLLGGSTYPTWADCLLGRLDVVDPALRRRLAALVDGADGPGSFDAACARFAQRAAGCYDGPARLVHVDYFPGNVMAEPDRITGVFDFAAHSLYGDPLLDVVGAIVMAGMFTDVTVAEQQAMRRHARARAGARLDAVFACYQAFYGLYYAMDDALLPWCAEQLRRAG